MNTSSPGVSSAPSAAPCATARSPATAGPGSAPFGCRRDCTTPICTSGDSSRYASPSCSGGYFVYERLIGNETYSVRPDTVLPDEPGHLG